MSAAFPQHRLDSANEYEVNRVCPSASFVATTHVSRRLTFVARVAWNPVVARSKNASVIP